MAFGGDGVGRLPDGMVCFVPGVIPGEVVEVRIAQRKKTFARGIAERWLEASPHRVKPVCAVYGQCGGCQYQHIRYAMQLEIKRDQVAEALVRLGGFQDPVVEPTMASPLEYGYRNRVALHTRRGKTGFYFRESREIVEVANCPIACEAVNSKIIALLSEDPDNGEHTLRESVEFRGFRQVNDAVAGLLVGLVGRLLESGGRLLVDAYCGAGFFAQAVGDRFQDVIGIEWSADAVRYARAHAAANTIYLQGEITLHLVAALEAAPAHETTVLLDPPAEGLGRQVIDTLLARRPSRILYVSCDPATLARDLKLLAGAYRMAGVHPLDMFPQTAQIECVALLEKYAG